jgi:PAS domain S-box-containing protein
MAAREDKTMDTDSLVGTDVAHQPEALLSAADIRRARLIVIGLTCLAGVYAVLFGAVGWLIRSPRVGAAAVLALLSSALYFLVWRLIVSGQFTLAMRLFIAGVLAIVLAETYVIPDELVTWVIAAFLPFGLALQFTFGRTPIIAAAAGLVVAINALVLRAGLHFSAGFSASLLGWLDVAGGVIVLFALALLLTQIRGMSEARALRLLRTEHDAAIAARFEQARLLEQQQLAEVRAAELHALVAASPDAVIGLDIEGVVTAWNPRAEAIFGWTAEEMVGQRLADRAVPPEYRDAHMQGLKAFRETGAAPVLDKLLDTLTGVRKDGTLFPIELVITKRPTETGLTGFIGFVRDITERKHLERQLHQAQRLESLGELAGGIAHDFNNLLAVIMNYAAFVREELTRATEGGATQWDPVGRDVEQIQRAAERAAALTHQLLAFARREVIRPRPLDLGRVVAEMEQLLRRTLGEHIELTVGGGTGLWTVTADSGQLEQVLVNLAVNARDAMGSGGTLAIDTANVEVDLDDAAARAELTPGHYVRLRVHDTGSGMSAEVLHHAFEPFYTTKPLGEGTGLGLATIYGIVTQAGGYAQITSEPGVGTTFTAMLPATAGAGLTSAGAQAPMVRPTGTETILVVEDEDALLEVAERVLVGHGYRVMTASNGLEAVEVVRQCEEHIDLLVTDVVMPKMAGREAAAAIRALRPEIRVLYMSGYSQPVLSPAGVLDPGVLLVEKPFAAPVLLAKVREALSQSVDVAGHEARDERGD